MSILDKIKTDHSKLIKQMDPRSGFYYTDTSITTFKDNYQAIIKVKKDFDLKNANLNSLNTHAFYRLDGFSNELAEMYAKFATNLLVKPVTCLDGNEFNKCNDFILLNFLRFKRDGLTPKVTLLTEDKGEVDPLDEPLYQSVIESLYVYVNPYTGGRGKKFFGMEGVYALIAMNFCQAMYGTTKYWHCIYMQIYTLADNKKLNIKVNKINFYIIRALRLIQVIIAKITDPTIVKLVRRKNYFSLNLFLKSTKHVNKAPKAFTKWAESGDNILYIMFTEMYENFYDLSYMGYNQCKARGIVFLDRKSFQVIPNLKFQIFREIGTDFYKIDHSTHTIERKHYGAQLFLFWCAHTKVKDINSYVFYNMYKAFSASCIFTIKEIDSVKFNIFYFLEMVYQDYLQAWKDSGYSRIRLAYDTDLSQRAVDLGHFCFYREEESNGNLTNLKYFTSKSTPQSLSRHMEIWHTSLNKKKMGPEVKYNIPLEPITINGIQFTPLQSNHQVFLEGMGMHHCLAIYEKSIRLGTYIAFSVLDTKNSGDNRRATLGLELDIHKGSFIKVVFDQIRCHYNKTSDIDFKVAADILVNLLNGDQYNKTLHMYSVMKRMYIERARIRP